MVSENACTNEELIKEGLSYSFTIKELCLKFKISNRTVVKILKEAGWSPKISSSLLRLKKNGIDIKSLYEATNFYLNNKVTFEEIEKKFNISHDTLVRHLKRIDKLPSVVDRKSRQQAWNKGLSKKTDERVLAYAKTKSGYVNNYGYKKVWCDELGKTVNEHHYIWFKNTGIWPNFKNGEQIHHIDGNKGNNDFSNLILCSRSEHTTIHKQYEQIVYELIRVGYIVFDKETNVLIADKMWGKLND